MSIASFSSAAETGEARVSRLMPLGVHRSADEICAGGVSRIGVGPVVVSALEIGEGENAATTSVLTRALELRTDLLQGGSYIAIRYGVVLDSEADVVRICEPKASAWAETLEKTRGLVELTLKVAPEQRTERPNRKSVSGGSEYLMKLKQMQGSSLPPERRREIEAILNEGANRSVWRDREGGGTELVMLVPSEKVAEFRERGRRLAELDHRLPFILSGPWPIEVFADE